MDQVGLTVGVVVDGDCLGETDHHAPVTAAAGCRSGAVVQPAHRYWPSQVDLLFQRCALAVGGEVGGQPQGAQGGQLRFCRGGVAIASTDDVVGVIATDLAPEAGEHGAAAGEALAVASA